MNKKIIKRAINRLILTTLIVLICLQISAQDVDREKAKRGSQRMTELVSLSPEQTNKLDSLFILYQGRMTAIDKSDISEKEKGDQRKTLLSEKAQALKHLMTEQQYKKYLQIMEEHKKVASKRKIAPKKRNTIPNGRGHSL